MRKELLIVLIFCGFVKKGLALWCYECVSTQPGCGPELNWLWHWTTKCPEDDDVCVKILERKNAEVVITRACLSSVQGLRTDIPADHYEGCRPAALDVKLANYVNNSIKELDIYRNYYDSTMWCFCFLDHWCNDSRIIIPSVFLLIISLSVMLF
ncbi:hypothetical protein ILUMI_07095 [Ignelater luminosus]|uniref:Protein sleepless n=1 Tax=Ignelater luminosus TaxID=2038154 RepID=A0A8K0GGM5_IGNLU|nr:hypothetical protein ILUMI_07095 [Ignelater luminosus]